MCLLCALAFGPVALPYAQSTAPAKSPGSATPKTPKAPAKPPAKGPANSAKRETVAKAIQSAQDALASLRKGDDPKPILESLHTQLIDLAETADPVSDIEGFFAVASAHRIAILLAGTSDANDRAALIRCFEEAPAFLTELAFTLDAKDDAAGVAKIAARLEKKAGKNLNDFATLAAAICVVHDKECFEQANENRAVSDDPVALFEYFAANESAFPLGLRGVPPQLLVLTVNTTAKVDELNWALQRYRRDLAIGKRFFEIKYDEAHFMRGAPKKVSSEGLTLQNILRYGGVCIDQAYFAANVAKAQGVPSAILRAKSAEVGHAWVAYLVWNAQNAVFETRAGRYPEYRAVVGFFYDPQTGERLTEAGLCLRAALALTPVEKRQRGTALEDAGYALFDHLLPSADLKTSGEKQASLTEKLTPDEVTKLLKISEQAANLAPGSARAWDLGVRIGVTGSWTREQRNRWGEAIFKTLGAKYGPFAMDCLIAVIRSVKDHGEQNDMWNWLVRSTAQNGDMGSVARFNQATMFESDHDPDKAWECYSFILKAYADTSPKAADAARRVLILLKRNGKAMAEGVAILGDAWSRTTPPASLNPEFAAQSNWFKIGVYYALALKDAGRTAELAKVTKALGCKPEDIPADDK